MRGHQTGVAGPARKSRTTWRSTVPASALLLAVGALSGAPGRWGPPPAPVVAPASEVERGSPDGWRVGHQGLRWGRYLPAPGRALLPRARQLASDAVWLRARGEPGRVIAVLERAAALFAAAGEMAAALKARSWIADACLSLGRPAEADGRYADNLELRSLWMRGVEHPDGVLDRLGRAGCRQALGEAEAALELALEAIYVQEWLGPAEDLNLALARFHAALENFKQG